MRIESAYSIIDEANEACRFIEGLTFNDVVSDGKTIHAVVRSIEVIGEAASKISLDLRQAHTDVPLAEYYRHAQPLDPCLF